MNRQKRASSPAASGMVSMENKHIEKKMHILYLGENGFPYGFAAIQRALLISKGLIGNGAGVTVMSQRGVIDPSSRAMWHARGSCEGVKYLFASGTPYRPSSFMKRNWLKVVGLVREAREIKKSCKDKGTDAAIVSTMSFVAVLWYRILAKIFKFPLILNYVEYNSAISVKKSLAGRINDYMFEKYAMSLIDGAIVISEFLMSVVRQHSTMLPCMKVPVICDFEKYDIAKKATDDRYFLFCGSTAYMEVVLFILSAFALMDDSRDISLYLVLNGNEEDITWLSTRIRKMKLVTRVRILTDIPYDELVRLYVNAKCLLIPLRPTLQDEARFPHKIGEYTAAGSPIITTAYGEVNNYFSDNETAFISSRYDICEFAEKMRCVLRQPRLAKAVADRAWSMGRCYFDYQVHGVRIMNFIEFVRKKAGFCE